MMMTASRFEDAGIPTLSTLAASTRQRLTALLVSALLIAITVAASFSHLHLEVILPVAAILETICVLGNLLTAILLLSQFRASGLLFLAVIGATYAFIGLADAAYLIGFDGLFTPWGIPNIGSWIYILSHMVFPIAVAGYALYDGSLIMPTEPAKRGRILVAATAAAAVSATAMAVAVSILLPTLPRLMVGYRFAPVIAQVAAPIATVLVILACVVILARTRAHTVLQTWLLVALLASALDFIANAVKDDIFTLTWYASEVDRLASAGIILCVLLSEIGPVYRKITDLATIDALTGLLNRRALFARLDWLTAYGSRRPLSTAICMMDVDHFKLYNDRYGHGAGDECLKRVARALREAVRASDIVARYGGEEFLVILDANSLEGTQIVAEYLRRSVETLAIPHESSSFGYVTLSIGAAFGFAGRGGAEHLIAAADKALYQAKGTGRNRCVAVECDFTFTIPETGEHPSADGGSAERETRRLLG